MIRAVIGRQDYWTEMVEFDADRIDVMKSALKQPSRNPVFDPQYSFLLAERHLRIMLRRYSRGDSVSELSQYFPGLLDAWELSNRLAEDICREHKIEKCRDWNFDHSNLDYYNWCFWLVALAFALEIPDDQWHRLVMLIGGEGEDELLDRVIASHQPGRRIGSGLLHGKPYIRLLKAIDAPGEQQAALLRDFVDHWYVELERMGKDRLWWYDFGNTQKHPLEKGSYFGCWCIEAVAAVKAFGLNDALCLDHPNYPADLIEDGRSPRHSAPAMAPAPDMRTITFDRGRKSALADWLSRLLLGSKR